MANKWIRLWTDMPDDPKFRTIARKSGQPISLVMAVYVRLMVGAANANERGRTQLNVEDMATALDAEEADINAVIDAMQGRVLDGDLLTGWDKRQPLREDGSQERSKAWREKQKIERNRTQSNAPDKNQIREEKKEKTIPIGMAKKKADDVPKNRASQLPENFVLTDQLREFYRERIPRGDCDAAFAHFTAHHTARGSVMKNWQAAWRTWVLNELKFSSNGNHQRGSQFVHATATVMERAFSGCDVPEF